MVGRQLLDAAHTAPTRRALSPLCPGPLPVLLEQTRPQHHHHGVERGPAVVVRLAVRHILSNGKKERRRIVVSRLDRQGIGHLIA